MSSLRHVQVPFAWPRVVTASRVSFAILVLGAACTMTLLTALLPLHGGRRLAFLGLATSFAGTLAWWASHANSVARAFLRSVTGGAVHATFCGLVLAPALVPWSAYSLSDHLAALAFVGLPLGAVIGAGYAMLPAIVASIRVKPSHADVDHVLGVGAVWLGMLAVGHVVMAELVDDASVRVALVASFRQLPWIAPSVLGLLLGAAILLRERVRGRLLATIREGVHDRLRIVPRIRAVEEGNGLLPLVHGVHANACEHVLVRIAEPEREVLYREPATFDQREVLALLP